MLTANQVKNISKPGRYADRGGLYLNVSRAGTKSWVYRYQINKKRHEMGIGSVKYVSLREARQKADRASEQRSQGLDPKLARDKEKQQAINQAEWTFDRCAEDYIKSHKAGWKNEKHASQWTNTLTKYATPVIGDLAVDLIETSHVMQVLEPIWRTKTETASRVRGRIESVLSWATVQGYREGPNPALWRGHLDMLLPKRSKVQPVQHHNAMPYADIPSLMKQLYKEPTLSKQALAFLILTGCRTNEVLQAQWNEIDRKSKIWTIPGNRMKSGREHRVPLSKQAVELLESLPILNDWLFPSRGNRPLSNMAMLVLLKQKLKFSHLTVHGFRSSFRDWAAEVSHFPREIAEAALAHVITDKTEAAYQRGDLIEKRRTMMQEWGDYILPNN